MLALLRFAASVGAAVNWVLVFIAAVISVFVVYVGVAMYAVLRATDPDERNVHYQVFHDLLELFGRWWRR